MAPEPKRRELIRAAAYPRYRRLPGGEQVPERYHLIWRVDQHRDHIARYPYRCPPQLSDLDLHLFGEPV